MNDALSYPADIGEILLPRVLITVQCRDGVNDFPLKSIVPNLCLHMAFLVLGKRCLPNLAIPVACVRS